MEEDSLSVVGLGQSAFLLGGSFMVIRPLTHKPVRLWRLWRPASQALEQAGYILPSATLSRRRQVRLRVRGGSPVLISTRSARDSAPCRTYISAS